MIDPEYEKILARAKDKHVEIKRQMAWLSKFSNKNLDHVVADYHDEAFEQIDCLKCGNCCRQVGPLLRESDVKHLSKEIGMPIDEFIETQLRKDEDGDWVMKTTPCTFLCENNSCSVYDKRPHSCVNYPYTQERNIQRHLGRLAKNTLICPAAVLITEKIIERYCKRSDPDKDTP